MSIVDIHRKVNVFFCFHTNERYVRIYIHILVVFKEMLWYLSDKHLKNGEKCRFYSIFTAKNDIKWGWANLSICIYTF